MGICVCVVAAYPAEAAAPVAHAAEAKTTALAHANCRSRGLARRPHLPGRTRMHLRPPPSPSTPYPNHPLTQRWAPQLWSSLELPTFVDTLYSSLLATRNAEARVGLGRRQGPGRVRVGMRPLRVTIRILEPFGSKLLACFAKLHLPLCPIPGNRIHLRCKKDLFWTKSKLECRL